LLIVGLFILSQAPSHFSNILINRRDVFPIAIIAGILILIIAVIRLVIALIRKSRGQMANNDSENQPAFKGLPTATVFVFFAILPVLVGLLSFPALVAFSHTYHWVGLASAAIFLIVALTLVIYTIKLAVTKRVSWVWIIVTVIVAGAAIYAGGLILLFAGFFGMMGS
jgi:magnesium-transporting ATPase (P-type)